MVRYHYVLVFFDSGASPGLILDGPSALHSILVLMDISREISTASGVVITYIIRQTVSLPEEYQYGIVFRIQGFCQTEL